MAPLFESSKHDPAEEHHVLLDGGFGSFALSVSERDLWKNPEPASWAWSSDIPHHVTVTSSKVAVLRWDSADAPKVYSRQSVDRTLERFYDHLVEDRVRSNKTVVEHILAFFRRIRSLVSNARLPDARTTDVFLALLAQMIEPAWADEPLVRSGLAEDAFDLCNKIDQKGARAATSEVRCASGTLSALRLDPALAIRHSGGQLFQEAHFELLKAPATYDLFGLPGIPDVGAIGRGGTHYTPPALARMLAEQTLKSLGELSARRELIICDPACGSGAFLHEMLRAIRRLKFRGKLTIIGQDISSSAIAMARFALSMALRDWEPEGGAALDLKTGDSLGDLGIPAADVIVMNPPFVSFGTQTKEQRQQIKQALGFVSNARSDLSMAFVSRALDALNPNGSLGTLFPASLLALEAAKHWRAKIAADGDVRFLGSIGDFGLFSHALVQVACAVVCKSPSLDNSEFMALVTGSEARSTGEAFRNLRKMGAQPASIPVKEADWELFQIRTSTLKSRPTWRFPSPQTSRALRAIETAQVPKVKDLFDVHQGIQTGCNNALLLTKEEWHRLGSEEHFAFKLATMTDSIQNGVVVRPYYLFFPYTAKGKPMFRGEIDLKSQLPRYFSMYLEPNRDLLTARAAIRRAGRKDWWGLMHSRKWSTTVTPRIISKFFGAEGGFVGDYEANYFPVMGHVWFIKSVSGKMTKPQEADLLAAYVAILNSSTFAKLLSIYAPHVSGGQFDLSSRHVEPVPIPDLRELSHDPDRGRLVSALADQGKLIDTTSSLWASKTAQLVDSIYGAQITDGL